MRATRSSQAELFMDDGRGFSAGQRTPCEGLASAAQVHHQDMKTAAEVHAECAADPRWVEEKAKLMPTGKKSRSASVAVFARLANDAVFTRRLPHQSQRLARSSGLRGLRESSSGYSCVKAPRLQSATRSTALAPPAQQSPTPSRAEPLGTSACRGVICLP